MNFSQKLGLFILIAVSVLYVYFTYFSENVKLPELNSFNEKHRQYNPLEAGQNNENDIRENETNEKVVRIYVLDGVGAMHKLNRKCDTSRESSCFAYAIGELIKSPSKWEKSKGYTSEIPSSTKILSIRESSNSVMIDLSSDFEAGGGAESTYMRIKQLIKTANANTNLPVYLFIEGKQANVIGGEGVMIKQPLNERSLDG